MLVKDKCQPPPECLAPAWQWLLLSVRSW